MSSIRTRLALTFFGITLAAIAVIYAYVVPQLESRLRDQKLDAIAALTRDQSAQIERAISSSGDVRAIDAAVRAASDRANARVTLFGVSRGTQGAKVYPISDSAEAASLAGLDLPVAVQAARSGKPASGIEPGLAEAALPLSRESTVTHVVVFSQPLAEVSANVATIRRQILIAGMIAALLALLAGSIVARALSARVKRLEQAAEQVAAGDFSHPIPVDSDDELGQLARAFNEMQSQLAELDTARKQFIATASHELRTPITSLGGFVELLQDEDLDTETRDRFLEQLRLQVERLRSLALRLLDLSRLESGALELRAERADVAAIAEEVAVEFTPALAEHDAHLELRLARRPLKALCDPERVSQILRILIDNALTHTPAGTDVQVTAARAADHVEIVVRDRGPGIDPSAMNHIFEPFSTSNDAQGAGLGLAIARELAERMNGHLRAVSRSGETAFTLELPA